MPKGLNNVRTWFLISIGNFFIAALTGIIMRYAFVDENTVIPFRNILQAHSHLAMLGWVFLASFCLLFVSANKNNSLQNSQITALSTAQFAVIGMFVSFIVNGYNYLSIIFLSLHMIASIWLATDFIRLEKKTGERGTYRRLWIGSALFFLILSFLSPLGLGIISAAGAKGTALYFAAIQFFLHFQFNGWLLFVLLGLVWDILERNDIHLHTKQMKWGFRLLFLSCFLTFALAVAWSTPLPIIFITNGFGVVIQLAAAVLIMLAFFHVHQQVKEKLGITFHRILWIVMSFFLIKIIVQTAVVIPDIAVVAYTIRNYILAFIHLLLLGVISFGLIGIAYHYNLIQLQNKLSNISILLFIIGFIITELFLFLQGTMQWAGLGFMNYFHEIMFVGSVMLAVGIGLFIIAQKKLSFKLKNNHN